VLEADTASWESAKLLSESGELTAVVMKRGEIAQQIHRLISLDPCFVCLQQKNQNGPPRCSLQVAVAVRLKPQGF